MFDFLAFALAFYDLKVLVAVRVLDADEHSVRPSPYRDYHGRAVFCKLFLHQPSNSVALQKSVRPCKKPSNSLQIRGVGLLGGAQTVEDGSGLSAPCPSITLTSVRSGTEITEAATTYGGFTYEVEVQVTGHEIKNITITRNRTTSHAQKAEGVVSRILEQQKNDVDAVSGATTTSKALLKAVENALEGKQ